MDSAIDFIDSVKTKDDFIKFVGLLIMDYENNIEEWENVDIPSFLDALKNYTLDTESDSPTWNYFANILMMGSNYE